jgi:hypothetical protein
MRLLIHDANVLIDLINLIDIGLLDCAMTLPCVMATTDLVHLEVQTHEQVRALTECIARGTLSVVSSSVKQLAVIGTISGRCPQLSVADCSVIFHALDRSGVVLSGDGRLRKAAEARSLEVHGTPWMLGRMVEHRLLDPETAIQKLGYLISINQLLPQKECVRLMESWRNR